MLKYFEKRKKTYPQRAKGKFRNIKTISSLIFIAIYILTPFLRWQRGEGLSDQAILIDIVHSRGYFFFIKIWPEEVYYIAGLLIFAAVALFFITSLFGRVWCGYSCPQTVWTDLFVAIERIFQGDRNNRIQMDRKKMSFNKFFRKAATHISWAIISIITGFVFTLYFNDAFILTKQLANFDLSFSILCWIFGIAGTTYIMAGFAREQVCNYMCPYARFQSAMFDKDTLIISYDEKRGEDRKKYKKGEDMSKRGHCIDCKQCVVVCPQGIDIRDGLQMECIACGLCIDACNNVMAKIGLPPDLIKYDTDRIHQSVKNLKFRILRPRTFYYAAILLIVGGLLLHNITSKAELELNVKPNRNPLYVTLSSGDIRNSYTIKISNKSNKDNLYSLTALGIKDLNVKILEATKLDINNIPVKADSVSDFKIFITAKPENLLPKNNPLTLMIKNKNSSEFITHDSIFMNR